MDRKLASRATKVVKTRVLVIEGQLLFRKALCHLLATGRGITVVADAASLDPTVLSSVSVDIVLIDLDAIVVDIGETLKEIMPHIGAARVCVLTAFARPELMQRCLAAGVDGFIDKDTSPMELVRAIKMVAAGESYADPRVAGGLLRKRSAQPAVARIDGAELSQRENEIIRLIALGLSNKEISIRLGLSEKTVKNHISRIFAKLNITARTQAAVHAIRAGMI